MTLFIFLLIYALGAFIFSAIGWGLVKDDPEFDHTGRMWPEKCPVWFFITFFTFFWWAMLPLLIWFSIAVAIEKYL